MQCSLLIPKANFNREYIISPFALGIYASFSYLLSFRSVDLLVLIINLLILVLPSPPILSEREQFDSSTGMLVFPFAVHYIVDSTIQRFHNCSPIHFYHLSLNGFSFSFLMKRCWETLSLTYFLWLLPPWILAKSNNTRSLNRYASPSCLFYHKVSCELSSWRSTSKITSPLHLFPCENSSRTIYLSIYMFYVSLL